MALANAHTPPDDQRARTMAARIVGKLQTLDGVHVVSHGFPAAVSTIADEIRDLLDLIDERDAEVVRVARTSARIALSPCDVAAIAAAVQARYESILAADGSATGPIRLHLTELEARCRRAELDNATLHARLDAMTAERDELTDRLARVEDTDVADWEPDDVVATADKGPSK